MPCVYERKAQRMTNEQLHEAVEKVRKKELTLRAAALTYGIPKSTLSDHLCRVSSKRYGGCSTVLTSSEEQEIVVTCQILAEMGFPLTKGYVEVIVRDYLSSAFGNSGLPGRSWWEVFCLDGPHLCSGSRTCHDSERSVQCKKLLMSVLSG